MAGELGNKTISSSKLKLKLKLKMSLAIALYVPQVHSDGLPNLKVSNFSNSKIAKPECHGQGTEVGLLKET